MDISPSLLGTRPRRQEAEHRRELTELIYAAVGTDGWQEVVDRLGSSFGGVAQFIRHDHATGTGNLLISAGWEPDFVGAYEQHYARINPFLGLSLGAQIGRVYCSDELISPAELQRTEFYQDWMRHVGDVTLTAMLQRDPARALAISVLLRRECYRADRAALDRLRALTPHLLRAVQLDQQMQALRVRATTAERALGQVGIAMMMVERNGRIASGNAAAETLLAAADGLCSAHGILDAAAAGDSQALRAMIAGAALDGGRSDAGGTLRIHRKSGRAAYEVLVGAAPATTASGKVGQVLIFVRDPAGGRTASAAALRQLYGVSAAEARLLRALLDGATLDEAAIALRLGRETLRTQLRSVFRKLDVSSQRDLMRVATGSLAALA